MSNKQLQLAAWGMSAAVTVVAYVAWGQGLDWQLSNVSTYRLFPLLGLLAFSLMWSHYIASALRKYFKAESDVLRHYFERTSLVVLAAILAHPGLLAWQLWRDGLGLPPASTKAYVGTALYVWIIVGLIAWMLFLAYELRRKFGKRPWWKYVQYASDIAMILIFFHAIRLGSHLGEGWFRGVWYFYGITYVAALVYTYWPRAEKQ